MLVDFEAAQRIIEWKRVLERILPAALETLTPEGFEPVVQYTYVPDSVEILEIHDDPCPEEPRRYLVVGYRVRVGELDGWTVSTGLFEGIAETPIDLMDRLDLIGVDFREGIQARLVSPATEAT